MKERIGWLISLVKDIHGAVGADVSISEDSVKTVGILSMM